MTREMLFALVLGYLFGSVPFGLVLTRLTGKGDIRSIGSGNIGATNVLRTGNKLLAALTLILDCLYPVWLRSRGGKGVATFLGILIPLLPVAAIVYALIWILLLLLLRISSVAGMSAAVSAPITAAVLHSSFFPMLLGFALLVLWKHRENILRLTRGTEPRIGSGKA